MKNNVIIALDYPSMDEAKAFLLKLGGLRPFVKVGLELFCAEGAEAVRYLKGEGYSVFLDLKLHDIPNTVAGASRVLARLGADMFNVHASGGVQMMKAAREAAPDSMVIAVTQLTSTSKETMNHELLIPGEVRDAALAYAKSAKEAGLNGVVCSPLEAGDVKSVCGDSFFTVTPGVRFADGDKGDQSRVSTPGRAKLLGSDYIVVGRPITKDNDPLKAYLRCAREFEEGIA